MARSNSRRRATRTAAFVIYKELSATSESEITRIAALHGLAVSMSVARRADEKKAVLSMVQRINDPDALTLGRRSDEGSRDCE
jgi:hypothetical protein